jgi:hypothetical protein
MRFDQWDPGVMKFGPVISPVGVPISTSIIIIGENQTLVTGELVEFEK